MSLPCPGLECCESIFDLCEQILPPNPPSELTVTANFGLCACLGDEYSGSVTVTDGEAPYFYEVFSGALPIGLTLDPNTGIVSGTTLATGAFSFTIKVTDVNGSVGTAVGVIWVIGVTTTSIPNYVIGEPYSFQLEADGGSGSYVWFISSGTLPAGLTMSVDGLISGTSVEVASDVPIVFDVVDIECPYDPLTSCSDEICQVCIDSGFGGVFARGCNGVSPYTYTIDSGALPDGITLDETTGEFLGTATVSGNFTFAVLIEDLVGNTVIVNYTVGVIEITTLLVQSITINVPYSLQLEATGGSGNYTWTIESGALPDGLSMTEAGLISGTPTVDNDVSVEFGVRDSDCAEPVPPFDGVLVDHDGNPIVDHDGNPIGIY